MGQIALRAAIASFIGAAIMLVLAILRFLHLRRVRTDTEMFPRPRSPQPTGTQ